MIGKGSTFRCLGASNHAEHERQGEDYYATEPKAAELLLEVEPDLNNIWECACGGLHLANIFEKHGKLGRMSDIIKRADDDRIEVIDFLKIGSKGLLAEREHTVGR